MSLYSGQSPHTENAFLHVLFMFQIGVLSGVALVHHSHLPSAIRDFLRDLNEISYRHGIAISDYGMVFIMEEEDYGSQYVLSEGDYLRFGSRVA